MFKSEQEFVEGNDPLPVKRQGVGLVALAHAQSIHDDEMSFGAGINPAQQSSRKGSGFMP